MGTGPTADQYFPEAVSRRLLGCCRTFQRALDACISNSMNPSSNHALIHGKIC